MAFPMPPIPSTRSVAFWILILIGHGSVFALYLGFDAAWIEQSQALANGRADLVKFHQKDSSS